ncbi:MAG TPA: hypothetical protein VJ818_06325 [Actinomycetota bacterium]|nr:hypothetical protein [Actinomycetota bacterium]
MRTARRAGLVLAVGTVIALQPIAGFAVSMVGPTGTVSGWTLSSSGTSQISGGTLTVSSLLSSYTVTVQGDKAKMSEYSSGAYVTGGKTLSNALHVITSRTGGSGVSCNGQGTNATVSTTATTVASGPGGLLCSDIYSVTLSQATSITDSALATGHTYHIVLTYTLSGGL